MNRKCKKSVTLVVILVIFSSFLLSPILLLTFQFQDKNQDDNNLLNKKNEISSSLTQQGDLSVPWGTNVYQNVPWDYTGLFYDDSDVTDTFSSAKIQYEYIDDSSLNYEYSISDLDNTETSFPYDGNNVSMTEGLGLDLDNMQSNDDANAWFNSSYVDFEAEYSFTEETVGTEGEDIGFVDDNRFSTCEIVNGKDGHKNILKTISDGGWQRIFNNFATTHTTGTVEGWIYNEENDKDRAIYLVSGSNNGALVFEGDGNIKWYGSAYSTLTPYSANQWYHWKLEFDTDTDTVDIYINGTDEGTYDLINSPTYISKLRLGGWDDSGETTFWDAIDYSWSDGYESYRNAQYPNNTLGEYNGTHSFEDEVFFTDDDISYVDTISFNWEDVRVVDEWERHKSSLHLKETDGEYVYVRDSFTEKTSGTIEFWLYLKDTTSYLEYFFKKGSDYAMYFYIWHTGAWGYKGEGGATHDLTSYGNLVEDEWLHWKVSFDCDAQLYELVIKDSEGDLIVNIPSIPMRDEIDGVDHSYLVHNGFESYLDAIGYSWDSNYNIGDNLHYNHYLGTETFEDYNATEEGDYFGTYDFRDDAEGSVPGDWSDNSDYNCWANVTSEIGEHKNVLELYDNSGSGNAQINQHFANKTSGTVELWVRTTNVANYNNIIFKEDSTRIINTRLTSSEFNYYNGTDEIAIKSGISNQWYHVKYDFVDSNTFDWYIDGVLEGDDLKTEHSWTDGINNIELITGTSGSDFHFYIDAIGYSWDSEYDIGDNINPHGKQVMGELEDGGWSSINVDPHTSVGVSGEYNSHKKVLNLTDNSGSGNFDAYYNFGACYTDSVIEFYWQYTASGSYYSVEFRTYESSSMRIRLLLGGSSGDEIDYWDGSSWSNLKTGLSNRQWYHIKIETYDATNQYDVYVDGNLEEEDISYANPTISGMDQIRIFSVASTSGYSHYFDALSFSWDEDYTTYPDGSSWNEHCSVESVIDTEVFFHFTSQTYNNFSLLQVNMDSRHYTSLLSNTNLWFYNNTLDDWQQISESKSDSETLYEYDYSDSEGFDKDDIMNRSRYIRFRYYSFNESATELYIDQLQVTIYYKTVVSYTHTLQILGTWKYRYVLDEGLGSEYTTSWIYFNVIEQKANFETISESKYSSQWVITGTDTTKIISNIYEDNMESDDWTLCEAGDSYVRSYEYSTEDSYVSNTNPNTNYGSDSKIYLVNAFGGYRHGFLKISEPDISMYEFQENLAERMYIWIVGGNQKKLYHSDDTFDEETITWNNQPSYSNFQDSFISNLFTDGWKYFEISDYSSNDCYKIHIPSGYSYTSYGYAKESNKDPYLVKMISKSGYNASDDFHYYQTDNSEIVGIKSPQFSDKTVSNGDTFTITLETDQDNAQLKLLNDGVEQATLQVLQSNTYYGEQTVEVFVDDDYTFDQVKIVSDMEDTEYVKLFSIKAERWDYESEEDVDSIHLQAYGRKEEVINVGEKELKIYENDILVINKTITLNYEKHTEFLESTFSEPVYLSFYDYDNDYLDFNKFITYINYTINDQRIEDKRLTSNEFYADEGTEIDFQVYDSFSNIIYNQSRIVSNFIDITLPIYELKIKNEKINPVSWKLLNNDTLIEKSGSLFEDEILTKYIATGTYNLSYLEDGESEWEELSFDLVDNQYFVINRSQMCYLSLANQRGEFREFANYKVYLNEIQLYENVFYSDIGENVAIEIRDRFDISIKNESYVVERGDNYIPITLTEYSLKLCNLQEQFNHINITRDLIYYDSEEFWSEWVAPSEIIEFNLFQGYYRINLTDEEQDTYSAYAYTLNSDDVILISSDNTISNVLYNIQNVNTTLGNQITNVEISLSNQNSEINNSIINIDIDLSNINSSLGDMLINQETDIENIQSNLTSLYMFTNNSFINLASDINTSFVNVENNILSINQSISQLVVGVDNQISLVNGTITSMITEMSDSLLIMNSSINTNLYSLGVSIEEVNSSINNNYILLNNSIYQTNLNINDSRIGILNNLELVNNSISTLVEQVYSSVYLINNSIYSAVVDLGTSLELVNNTIKGDLQIILQQNEFLTSIYNKTMFANLLNWTSVANNYTKLLDQTDAYTIINNYRNQTVEVMVRYQNRTDSMLVTAQESMEKYLPKSNETEYRLKSVATGEYLTQWQPLPATKTVDFGFYEEEVAAFPAFATLDTNNFNTVWIDILLLIVFFGIIIGVLAALLYVVYKRYIKTSLFKQRRRKGNNKALSAKEKLYSIGG